MASRFLDWITSIVHSFIHLIGTDVSGTVYVNIMPSVGNSRKVRDEKMRRLQ